MRDPVVLHQLQSKGIQLSDEEMLRYDAIERKQRILDSAPPRIKMQRMDNIVPRGIAAQFADTYNEAVNTVDTEVFYVDINGQHKVLVDEKVFYVLRSLVIQNVSMSEEVSVACSELFKAIVLCGEDVVTEQRLYDIVTGYKAENYSAKVILEAIFDLCFQKNSTVMLWKSLAQSDGYYQYAIKRGTEYVQSENMTEKELKQFIKENGKLAREDKDFQKKLVKGVPTRALIAMIYYFREDEKMFEASFESAGFMV